MDRRQKAAQKAIREIIKQTGGVRRAERELKARHPGQLHYPSAGLLTQISKGERRPQSWLCDLLGIAEPERKPRQPTVPWRKVSVWLADNPANMVTALVIHGVDREKSEQIAARLWE